MYVESTQKKKTVTKKECEKKGVKKLNSRYRDSVATQFLAIHREKMETWVTSTLMQSLAHTVSDQ